MRETARALLERRLSPAEVAEQLGFGAVHRFNRAFTRRTGMTAAAYARERFASA